MASLQTLPNPGVDAARPSSSFRILCVDDNRDCADSTTQLMRALGFQAQACYDGHTALLMNDIFRPEVCFLDLSMPAMDGDELASQIRKRTGWQPRLLVALTAMNDEASRQRMKAAGVHLHLVKGNDPRQVLTVVESLFRMVGPTNP